MFPDDDAFGSPDEAEFGVALMDAIVAFLHRFVGFRDHAQATAVALWIVHTHAFDAFRVTPYLEVTSAEPGSGKSRLLKVLRLLTVQPWLTVYPTAAVLFRSIERDCPTLLLDEVDKYAPDAQRAVWGILNDGYEEGGSVRRVETIDRQRVLVDYSVFCPKAFAGIGSPLPDTTADRCIPIRMRKRAPHEPEVEPLETEREIVDPQARALRDLIAVWASVRIDDLRTAKPDLPAELVRHSDRAAQVWRPLLAIADMVGGGWHERARAAAVELHLRGFARSGEAEGVLLLRHIRESFDKARADKITTKRLLGMLVRRIDGPWSEKWGEALAAGDLRGPGYRLARMLGQFEIKPHSIRMGAATPNGFYRSDFEDAWSRYLRDDPATDDPNNGTTEHWTATRLDEEPSDESVFRRSIDPPP
jgi:hypothetical protein